jgi:hypothetical protein
MVYQVFFPSAASIQSGAISAEGLKKEGTAFLLNETVCSHPDGYRLLMTNHHVVQNALEQRAKGVQNLGYVRCLLEPLQFFQINLILSDAGRDIAVIVIPEHAACRQPGFVLDLAARLSEGEHVRFWGFPRQYHGCSPLLTFGHVAGLGTLSRPGAAPTPTYIVSASVHSGHSGSPVLARDGRVIGLLVSKHTDVTEEVAHKLAMLQQATGALQWTSPDGSRSLDLIECISDALLLTVSGAQLGMCEAITTEAIRDFLSQIPAPVQFAAMLPPPALPTAAAAASIK